MDETPTKRPPGRPPGKPPDPEIDPNVPREEFLDALRTLVDRHRLAIRDSDLREFAELYSGPSNGVPRRRVRPSSEWLKMLRKYIQDAYHKFDVYRQKTKKRAPVGE